MVSSGGGEIGAAKLTSEILAIIDKVPELAKSMTGVDIKRVSNSLNIITNDITNNDHDFISVGASWTILRS